MAVRNVPLADAGPSVADVMLSGPRTIPGSATVGDLREQVANPRVRMVLVADGERYLGCVRSEAVLGHPDDATRVDELLDPAAARVAPGDPVAHALALLDAEPSERLPVVDEHGRLAGLICFNRRRGHFCVDA